MMHSSKHMNMIKWSLLCLIFSLLNSIFVFAAPVRNLCLPDQKDALWEFKNEFYLQNIFVDGGRVDKKTERWMNNTDCCSWDGVTCDSNTGNVVVSRNKLEGNIPESIGLLKELIVLNMSNNAFTGRIPPSLSNLTNLQSLDLSHNKLSSRIPPDLGKLTFLAWMNFSYNKLEGPIPQGTQIQSQNSSAFAENPGLYGAPLEEKCGVEDKTTKQEEEDEQVLSWIAAAIAYVPGVFCGLTIGHILFSYKHEWFMKIFHSCT